MKQNNFSDEKIEMILRNFSKQNLVAPSKEAIDNTVYKVNEIIQYDVRMSRINFFEFLTIQIRLMKKRWWILQSIVLFCASQWIVASENTNYSYRGLSILASLFVIFIIPELWKNVECKSIEIEMCSLFDLKRVYAAKLIACGLIDTFLLTLFCVIVTSMYDIMISDILKQFVFPIVISSTVCLMSFSNRKKYSEYITMVGCIFSNLIWIIIIMNEKFYSKLTPLIWIILFSICICLIIYSIRRTIYKSRAYLEVKINEISTN